MNLIYGSTALKHWIPESRNPNDLDVITEEKLRSSKEKQFYWTKAFGYLINNKDKNYVDLDLLFTIKVSHSSWDINWTKTMKDIGLMQQHGAKLNKEFYNLLLEDWTKIHKKKQVNLNVKNEDFFKSNIKRKYNHDYLHTVFAFYERPLNERIRKDLSSPMPSEELWNQLSQQDKIKCSVEELMVLSTERYILPLGIPLKTARYKALKQMIVSSTKGFFNLFLILNFEEILKSENEHFTTKLKGLEC